MEMIDLTAAGIEQEETGEVKILHPTTGDELGIVAEVYGQDSEIFRKETRAAEVKFQEYARRNRGKFMPPEDREKLDRAKVLACIKSITPFKSNGVEYTDKKAILEKFPFIYEQISAGIMDRANFTKGSSPT